MGRLLWWRFGRHWRRWCRRAFVLQPCHSRHLVSLTLLLCGRRAPYSIGLALLACLGRHWRRWRELLCSRAGTRWHQRCFLSGMHCTYGTGVALVARSGRHWGRWVLFVWQAGHKVTLSVAFGDIDVTSMWQAWSTLFLFDHTWSRLWIPVVSGRTNDYWEIEPGPQHQRQLQVQVVLDSDLALLASLQIYAGRRRSPGSRETQLLDTPRPWFFCVGNTRGVRFPKQSSMDQPGMI